MKPSERFTKKVWRKPPKKDAKGFKVKNKIGLTKCSVCKEIISSTKRRKAKDSFNVAKISSKTNRPYGGNVCTKCLRKLAIAETRKLESEA